MTLARQARLESTTHPLAKKRMITLITLVVLLIVATLGSLMIGPVKFTLAEVWQGITVEEDTLARRIVWDLRIPRVLIGLMVGMCLAVAGSILQGVMRNPLADPGIIGVSSGAGLAAVFIMILSRLLIS